MPRVGIDPVPVVRMEDHDRAYAAWLEAGVADRVVLHLDAHLDLEPLASRSELESALATAPDLGRALRAVWARRLTIGNFLTAALERGIARRILWVVADASWPAVRDLALPASVEVRPLSALEAPDEPVLLDVDADVFLPRVETLEDPDRVRPLLWPDDLVEALAARGVESDLATVCASVRGNYVPARLRFLADDVAALLAGRPPPARDLRRRAAEAWSHGDLPAARAALEEALAIEPGDAASSFQLALVDLESGRLESARARYAQAVARDPIYGCRYNHLGPLFLSRRRLPEARRSYERMALLDPGNPDLEYGLGWLALEEGRPDEAARRLAHFAAAHPASAEGHREHAIALSRAGRPAEALDAIDRSLALDPTSAEAHSLRARSLDALGRPADAESARSSARRYGA